MSDTLQSAPEDNIYLEIQMKRKDGIASSCNCLCFIFFVLNIAVIFLLWQDGLDSISAAFMAQLIGEISAWLDAIIITSFMCCNYNSKSSMAVFVMVIVVSVIMPFVVILAAVKKPDVEWNFYLYSVFCLVRLGIVIYLILKMRILRDFNKKIRKIEKRIKKLKRRKKNYDDNYPKVAILEQLIHIDEELTFQYSCSGSVSPTSPAINEFGEDT